jgi:hypothetical protein
LKPSPLVAWTVLYSGMNRNSRLTGSRICSRLSQPFLDQLKKITEVPRNIELLNREIVKEQARLAVVDRALANIAQVSVGIEDEHVLQRLAGGRKNMAPASG